MLYRVIFQKKKKKKVFWLHIIQKLFHQALKNCLKILISGYEKLIWYHVKLNGLSTIQLSTD